MQVSSGSSLRTTTADNPVLPLHRQPCSTVRDLDTAFSRELWSASLWRGARRASAWQPYKGEIPSFTSWAAKVTYKKILWGLGQDGGRVRCGDHLPSHRYIRNTSTRGTAPTEHSLNAGRRRQTSQKARNSTRTWVGQKKKK